MWSLNIWVIPAELLKCCGNKLIHAISNSYLGPEQILGEQKRIIICPIHKNGSK